MLSVSNMLNEKKSYQRPSVLNIHNLLNTHQQQQQQKSPSLSPSLTYSPTSTTSSYTSYPFPTQQQQELWDDLKQHRSNTPVSMDSSLKDSEESSEEDDNDSTCSIKAKRRRANAKQLEVLNRVFDRTFFPSTQMRAELGRQLGMSPRTVQIWFQNRRQAMRTRERQRLIRLRNTTKDS